MKRRIAAAAFASALLISGPVAATANAAPTTGSSDIGCTSTPNPSCPAPVKLLLDLLTALTTGSAGGGKPAA
ncbi:hypothetical protein AB0H76_22490 [Nocardia sp. NPDC050712]|uniref:hypothetical protein n=1 Tax=Nocardia sp. NPDC050712 TaxID=3155518 RepID=UPI0033E46B2F